MTIDPAQNEHYPLSFTATSLRPELARIVSQAYLDCGDWEQAKQMVLAQNLLQARSPASGIRMERELRQRLQTLTRSQLELLAHAPLDSRRAMAWLAALKYAPFIFAFAREVLRPKYEMHDTILRPSDYESFFDAQATSHLELAQLADSTRVKIRTVIINMLREAGIIAQPGRDLTFNRPVLPPEALVAIVTDDPGWLVGFLVPNDEIKSHIR